MKNGMIVLLTALLGAGCQAADVEQPHIVVVGTAQTEAVPDELVWSLTVKTDGAEVEPVAAAHAAEVSAVLDFLKTYVEKKDLRTDRMRLSENWVYQNRTRVQEGYAASTGITFTSRDFSQYLALWTGLSKQKNTSINNAGFRVSDIRKIQDELRVKAVADARAKAVALAEAGGVALYEPIVIEEMPTGRVGIARAMDGFAKAELAEPVEPGSETVQASITVYFRIGSKK